MSTTRTLILCFAAVTLPAWQLDAQIVPPSPFFGAPARIVGQASLNAVQYSSSPNLVEGRELWSPAGIALDASTGGLYVSDTLNNRVLGWRNAASFSNGAYADIVVGQPEGPNAMTTTNPQGPCCNPQQTRGLHWPTGLAVDTQGNLYVVDAGNNRILRYPTPFAAGSPGMNPDIVIGQPDFNSYSANQGGGATPAAGAISPLASNSPVAQALVFDTSGNLWYADTGNHRVLRFPAGSGGKVQGTADHVLGQLDFVHAAALPETNAGFTNLSGLRYPTGLAMDATGRIYVSDSLARVLIYQSSPQAAGNPAMKMLGQVVVPSGQQPPATPNATQFGYPAGLAMIANNTQLVVADAVLNRLTVFAPLDSWLSTPSTPPSSSPAAITVIGQTDYSGNTASAAASGLSAPSQVAFSGSELFVADSGNNRVVVFPQAATGGTAATRELGQLNFGYFAPNLIEGRELYLFAGFYSISGLSGALFADSGGVAVDSTSTPPRLYIADTYNNRVLGFADARSVHPGDTAGLVIGQPDRFGSGINGPANSAKQPSATGLNLPAGLAVDSSGNLYVADRGNSRVLRFPSPFNQPNLVSETANLVLGQADFTSPSNTSVSDRTMAAPYGLAFMPEGHLLVSDMDQNRVLLFKLPQGGGFSSGQPADGVIGQSDFYTATSSQGLPDKMASPRGIGMDTSGRLYVADAGNNRILVWGSTATYGPSGGPAPVLALTNSTSSAALKYPQGVVVSPADGAIWVAESGAGRILQYPEFVTASLTGLAEFILPTASYPLGLALDGFQNLLVVESANRVSMYFPPLWITSALNFLPNSSVANTYAQPCCAPGSWASAWPFSPGNSFGSIATASASSLPFPTMLGDTQVLVGGVPAPLWYVTAGQINFQVPQNTSTTFGVADVLVQQASTGRVLAWSIGTPYVSVGPAAPALNLWPGYPTGTANGIQVIAQQFADNPPSCNGQAGPASPSCPGGVRPANRGETITLYATGQGLLTGMPADGAAASGQVSTPTNPQVFMGTAFVPAADVTFSGLAPALVGVWQINVTVPQNTTPGPVWIMLFYGDEYSSVRSTTPSATNPSNPFTVIQVK
ncbi:MAG: hypothetical protein ACLQGV_08195 [Bryobacteraceae bacterium]